MGICMYTEESLIEEALSACLHLKLVVVSVVFSNVF